MEELNDRYVVVGLLSNSRPQNDLSTLDEEEEDVFNRARRDRPEHNDAFGQRLNSAKRRTRPVAQNAKTSGVGRTMSKRKSPR